jgi:redox-sensitive bicupin YhaK (pirin superfamily)
MIIHPADTRGGADHGWLRARHSFSFAEYYDPSRMGFGALRVINDDAIAPDRGFGAHPHRDMEIITIPLEGTLRHQDSMGNTSEIQKGEVQLMSAGTGVVHSEFNASADAPVKLLQIWVLPKLLGIKPRYEQRSFPLTPNELRLLISPDGEAGSVRINQDAWFSQVKLEEGREITYELRGTDSGVYAFVIDGEVELAGELLRRRDGAGLAKVSELSLFARRPAEVLLIEVPMLGLNP